MGWPKLPNNILVTEKEMDLPNIEVFYRITILQLPSPSELPKQH
jgi:hypothetical protein